MTRLRKASIAIVLSGLSATFFGTASVILFTAISTGFDVRSIGLFALVAVYVSPMFVALGIAYSAPLLYLLALSGLTAKIRSLRNSLWAVVVGLVTGLCYWALIDVCVPFYPADRERMALKLACYLGSGAGIAAAFWHFHRSSSLEPKSQMELARNKNHGAEPAATDNAV